MGDDDDDVRSSQHLLGNDHMPGAMLHNERGFIYFLQQPMKEALSYPRFTDGKLKFNKIYAAWKWQGWAKNTGNLGTESSVFPNSPALLYKGSEYQFLPSQSSYTSWTPLNVF